MGNSAYNLRKIWKPAAIAAAVIFIYWAVLMKLGFDWWTDENYSHGLLVPIVIGYVIWMEFDELKKAVDIPRYILGGCMIVFALALLFGGTLGAELFTQRISLVLTIAGIVVYFWGAGLLRLLAVPFALLLLSIPLPQVIFNKIAMPLQLLASQFAVWGIRLFEVASVRKGNVIEILPLGSMQTISMEVVEACSGIRSLMTLVTLGLILAYFTRNKGSSRNGVSFVNIRNFDFWRALILMSAAVPIAIATNAARVAATGVLAYHYGKQATEGFIHSSAGWLVYVTALALLILINSALVFTRRLLTRNKVISEQ